MNVPKIRLKGFDGEWEKCVVNDITNRYDNLRIPVKESERQKGNIPYYGANGIQDYVAGYTHEGSFILVAEDGASDLDHYPVQYVEGKIWVNNHAHVLGTKGDNSTLFLKYLISEADIKSYLVGGGRAKLNADTLMNLPLTKPSLREQEQLGQFFKTLDAMIEAAGKKIASLKQTRQACLQQMFPAEGETTPRVRFKGFEGEWQVKKIGELGTTYSGLSGKSKADFGLGSAQYITFLNVLTNAHIDATSFESVNIKPGEKQNKVVKGDILFNTSSETPEEVGYCSVLMNDVENLYLNSFCFGFRPFAETIDPEFMVYLIRGQIGRSIMKVLAQGATRYNLSKNRLCEAAIPAPSSKEEQQQIAAFFSNMDKQIRIQEQRLEKLKQIKATCLENMFV